MAVTFRGQDGAVLSGYSGCLRSVYTTIFRTVQVTTVRTFRNLLQRSQFRRQSLTRYFTAGPSHSQSHTVGHVRPLCHLTELTVGHEVTVGPVETWKISPLDFTHVASDFNIHEIGDPGFF